MDEDDQKVLLTAWLSRNRELLTWAMIPISVEHNQFQKYVPVLWTLRAPLDHWDKNPEVTLLIVRKIWERGWNVMSSNVKHVKGKGVVKGPVKSRIHFRFRSPCSSYSAVDSQIVKYMVYAETYKSLHNPVETQWKIKKIEG